MNNLIHNALKPLFYGEAYSVESRVTDSGASRAMRKKGFETVQNNSLISIGRQFAGYLALLFGIMLLPLGGYGQCVYTLELNDTYGDGWNGNTIDVTIDGVTANYTLGNGFDTLIDLGVTTGDSLQFSFNRSGSWIDETSFMVYDANNALIYSSGIDPAAGIHLDTTAVCPLCPAPSGITLATAGVDSLTVQWIGPSAAGAYTVEWGPCGFAPGTGSTATVTDTNVTANGLMSGSCYDFYFTSDCSVSSNGFSATLGPISFHTVSAIVDSFPYIADFESGTNGFIDGGTNSSWEHGVPAGIDISTAASGSNAWVTNLSGSYNNSENSELVSPVFDFSAETDPVVISFDLQYITEACCDEGWLDMSFDGTTWHKVVENTTAIGWYNDLSNNWWDGTDLGWSNRRIIIDSLAGMSSVQFRFRFSSDGSVVREGFAIDNFEVVILDCSIPANISASALTASSADIYWSTTAPGSNIEYGPTGFTQGTGATIIYNATSPQTISGLDTATTYDVYVQDSCGVGTLGLWNGPYTFTTLQAIIDDIPFMEDFENGQGGWITGGSNNSWEFGVPAGTVIDSAASPIHAWVTNLSGNYNNSEESYIQSPIFDLSAVVMPIELSFDLQYITESCCDEGWVEVSIDGINFHKIVDNGTATNWYNDLGNQWWDDQSPWALRSIILDTLAGKSFVQFRFRFSSDGSVIREGFAVDNFALDTLDCSFASNFTIDSLTNSSATISWNSIPGNSNVEWGPAGFTPGSFPINFNVPNPYTITGLTSATAYDVYIQENCGSGNLGLWTGPYTFITGQDTINSFPYMQDFDNGPGGWLSAGQNNSWQHGTPAATVINSAASGSSAWVTNLTGNHNNNEYSELRTTVFDFSAETDTIMLSFDMQYITEACCDEGWLEVAYDNTSWHRVTGNPSAFNWYNDVTNQWWDSTSTPWSFRSIIIDSLAGKNYVQFRFIFSSNAFTVREGFAVDNFALTPLDCSVPTGVTTSNITTSSATVNWTTTAVGSNIEWGPAGFTQGTSPIIHNVSSPYVISGLNGATSYEFYIQDSCLTGNTGVWAGPYPFTTLQDTISSFPYSEDFESDHGGWVSGGANSSWEYGMPAGLVITTAALGDYAWVTNLTGDYNNNEESYLRTPVFDFTAVTDPVYISFDLQYVTESCCDEGWFEVTYNGTVWHKVVGNGTEVGWYNDLFNQWWDDGSGTTWVNRSITIDTLAGKSAVQFRYRFSSDFSVVREGFGVDNFNIVPLTCPTPTGITTSSITGTSATINWTSTSPGTNIEVGIAGFVPGTGTMYAGVTSPFGLSGLSSGTNYEFYIQDSCGVGNLGIWSGPFTFTTLQNSVNTFPYSEDFELDHGGWISGGTASSWEHGVPAGTIISGASSGTQAWVTNLTGNYNNSENSYLQSVIFDCSALTNDLLYSFDMIYETENCCDEGWVEYTLDGVTWTKLIDNGKATNWYSNTTSQWWNGGPTTWTTSSNEIPGSAGQSYVQVRHVFSSDGSVIREGFGIDQIYVEEYIPCPAPTGFTLGNIDCFSASMSWSGSNSAYWVEYDTVGFAPGTANGSTTTNNMGINLTGLNSGQAYDVYVYGLCPDDTSAVVGPLTFTTDSGGVPVPSGTHVVSPATATYATVSFDGSASSNMDSLIWDFGDPANPGAGDVGITTSYDYTVNGTYNVTLSAVNACTTVTTTITVLVVGISVEEQELDVFDIYPNPTTGAVHLSYPTAQGSTAEILLTDLQGRRVMNIRVDLNSGERESILDLSHLPKGVYLVHWNGENTSRVERIVLR